MARTLNIVFDDTSPWPISVEEGTAVRKLAETAMGVLHADLTNHLDKVDRYLTGEPDGPYIPPQADAEYKLLAGRSASPWPVLLVSTPAQGCYVDGFRPSGRGKADGDVSSVAPPGTAVQNEQWDHWQRSRLDARQGPLYRAALGYGHAFTLTEKHGAAGKTRSRGLSPLRTVVLYDDPAWDEDALFSGYLARRQQGETPALWRFWHTVDGVTREYEAEVDAMAADFDGNFTLRAIAVEESENPITRFTAAVDLDGRTTGVVEPMIPLVDRINQTTFDLLIAQTYSSFKVRWATGMNPPVERDPETGEVKLGEDGNPIALPINLNAKKFLINPAPDGQFGTLDETPLKGYIESIDASIRHLAAISQVPPHHLLGQVSNLSAEALAAAESALTRKIAEFQTSFGESWERVFRVAAQLEGREADANDFHAEVIWRDVGSRSLTQTADALSKFREGLGVPAQGLWDMIPGVTQGQIDMWTQLLNEQNAQGRLTEALLGATGGGNLTDDTVGGEVSDAPIGVDDVQAAA